MNINEKLNYYQQNFDVVGVFFLSGWSVESWISQWKKFEIELASARKSSFADRDRIVFVFDPQEYDALTFQSFFKKFIQKLFEIDISNFFAVLLTSDDPAVLLEYFKQYSPDPVLPTVDTYSAVINHKESQPTDTFCILPWNHLMVTPYQTIKTCCMGQSVLGQVDKNTLAEVWNNDTMTEIRQSLLQNKHHPNCSDCYTNEKHGNQSLRQKLNSAFEQQVAKVKQSNNAVAETFELKYFDLRFTNLCNIRCRTCNHHSSSKWYQDTVKLDPLYAKPVLMKAGRHETDIWEQLESHLDCVEQIYFAGGEPLIMEEHYKLLDELEHRGRFDVRLVYNTNFTQTKLKDREVFDYWRKFKTVRVGASLDAMGDRADYIRKDSKWAVIESNRRAMMEICPEVHFEITPTVSIMNVMHLPDFHQHWVELGLIRPQDVKLNILQDPHYYRIDIASDRYKQSVEKRVQEHCEWLKQYPNTETIQQSYMSVINYMFANDNTQWLPEFWQRTRVLDSLRNEEVLQILPELWDLL